MKDCPKAFAAGVRGVVLRDEDDAEGMADVLCPPAEDSSCVMSEKADEAEVSGFLASKVPDLPPDRKSTRLNSSHVSESRMPSSA